MNNQVFHPQCGTGSIVDILQRNDQTIIDVAFQNGERFRYNKKNASKLEIEDESIILVGSRVQTGGHEGVVVQIHPTRGFKLSKFEDEHHDQWIEHRSKNTITVLPGRRCLCISRASCRHRGACSVVGCVPLGSRNDACTSLNLFCFGRVRLESCGIRRQSRCQTPAAWSWISLIDQGAVRG